MRRLFPSRFDIAWRTDMRTRAASVRHNPRKAKAGLLGQRPAHVLVHDAHLEIWRVVRCIAVPGVEADDV